MCASKIFGNELPAWRTMSCPRASLEFPRRVAASSMVSMRSQLKLRWAERLGAFWLRRSRAAVSSSAIAPVPPTPAWDEAFLRVESHLRAYRIESRVRLNQLSAEIIADARLLAAEHPAEAPVTLAMQVTHARIGAWLVHALGEGDWADERFRARGRLALLLADIPRHWPELFLATVELPHDLKERLASAQLQAGPELVLSRMPSAPLEIPLTSFVDEKWRALSRAVVVRSVGIWCGLFGLLGLAWAVTH